MSPEETMIRAIAELARIQEKLGSNLSEVSLTPLAAMTLRSIPPQMAILERGSKLLHVDGIAQSDIAPELTLARAILGGK